MLLDYTYCVKECSDMECKHNKKHLDNLYINEMKVVGAVSWGNFVECTKGENDHGRKTM